MLDFIVRSTSAEDQQWIEPFIVEHWGANSVVGHGVEYYPHELAGFVALQNKLPVGLVTYHILDQACEIVTLNSEKPGIGIGTALIASVKLVAMANRCTRLWLVTTNDNMDALRFYQKRGYELVQIHRNAVEKARRLKPSIPLYGIESIPIRDEIELEMPL